MYTRIIFFYAFAMSYFFNKYNLVRTSQIFDCKLFIRFNSKATKQNSQLHAKWKGTQKQKPGLKT